MRFAFNEINTLPGMTATSRYPRMMGQAGIPFETILDTLIERRSAAGEDRMNCVRLVNREHRLEADESYWTRELVWIDENTELQRVCALRPQTPGLPIVAGKTK